MFGYLLCCIYCFESLVIAKVILLLFSFAYFYWIATEANKIYRKKQQRQRTKEEGIWEGEVTGLGPNLTIAPYN